MESVLIMKIRFYDTKEREKKLFKPINSKDVKFYVCGPTVYDRAHIGNARPAVVFDILFRFLRYVYGENCVTYVRNFTDIDDKINQKSKESNKSIRTITDQTIAWYNEDMTALNVLPPNHSPRATEYIAAMIKQIETLIERKNAYADGNGHILFSVKSAPNYGILSKRKLEEMKAGSRVEILESKFDSMDFVLWKPSDEQTPGWASPWGRGRPGWHIECSAMIFELLGTEFDIHGGGIDLVFPHHENELVQSNCAHPGAGFANFWMHNGFLQIEGQKMSKSAGNFFTVEDLRESGMDGEIIRMILLSTHYRQPLDWTAGRVAEISTVLKKWRNLCKGVKPAQKPDESILNALADDLNTPLVFSEIHRLSASNKLPELLGSLQFLGLLLDIDDRVDLQLELGEDIKKKIEDLLNERTNAKISKDFLKADVIRKQISEAGITISDTATGTDWTIENDVDIEKLKDLL